MSESADNSSETKAACRWPKKKPWAILATSDPGPVSAQRKNDDAEARCRALPLRLLLLPWPLLQQGQLPLFETETTAGDKAIQPLGESKPPIASRVDIHC